MKVKDRDFKTVILIENKRFLEDMCEMNEVCIINNVNLMWKKNIIAYSRRKDILVYSIINE